jgi:hypothetical protein
LDLARKFEKPWVVGSNILPGADKAKESSSRDKLETLRRRDLGGAANTIAMENGIPFRPSEGEHVAVE